MSDQKQVIDRIAIQGTQLVSEQTWDEVDVMRLLELEPLTVEVIVRLGGSENCGSVRVEWIIIGCWISRHDTIVEHDGSRRTDVPWAYIVRGQNYRLRIEWTKSPEVIISLSRTTGRPWFSYNQWGSPSLNQKKLIVLQLRWGHIQQSYCTRVQYTGSIRPCLELGYWNPQGRRVRLSKQWLMFGSIGSLNVDCRRNVSVYIPQGKSDADNAGWRHTRGRVSRYIGPDPRWACVQNNKTVFSPNLIHRYLNSAQVIEAVDVTMTAKAEWVPYDTHVLKLYMWGFISGIVQFS